MSGEDDDDKMSDEDVVNGNQSTREDTRTRTDGRQRPCTKRTRSHTRRSGLGEHVV